MSLSPCSVPGCLPSFDLPPGAMELGLGETEERMLLCKRQESQFVYKIFAAFDMWNEMYHF